jgi:hypothetical protein
LYREEEDLSHKKAQKAQKSAEPNELLVALCGLKDFQ